MISTIIQNARVINTQEVMGRVTNLIKIQLLSMLQILEQFTDNSYVNNYRISFYMDKATCNKNGKIWLFQNQEVECKVFESDEEQINCEITHFTNPVTNLITVVYPNVKKTYEHLSRINCFIMLIEMFCNVL